MALSYTWHFPHVETAPQEATLLDVAKVVHWRLEARDGDHSAAAYGTVAIAPPSSNGFVPFAELTPAMIESWTRAALGEAFIADMEADLAGQIAQQAAPAMVVKQPPWLDLQAEQGF